MNKKLLFSIPMIVIGLTMIVLGTRWMVVDEPWMLDKIANEERLEMTFDELFKADINKTLPDYLRQIYRFFGLWVIIIGLFITLFSIPKIITNKNIELILLFCVGVTVYSGLFLAYILIPSSPFIYLGWILLILHLVSVLNYKNIK
tara:strand:+ start:168 stop:605 length:438 start_codon:yes stop_codon:yes gene_type:complete